MFTHAQPQAAYRTSLIEPPRKYTWFANAFMTTSGLAREKRRERANESNVAEPASYFTLVACETERRFKKESFLLMPRASARRARTSARR